MSDVRPEHKIANIENLPLVVDRVRESKGARYLVEMCMGASRQTLSIAAINYDLQDRWRTLEETLNAVNRLCGEYGIEPPAIVLTPTTVSRTQTGRAIDLMVQYPEFVVSELPEALMLYDYLVHGTAYEDFEVSELVANRLIDYLRVRDKKTSDLFNLNKDASLRIQNLDSSLYSATSVTIVAPKTVEADQGTATEVGSGVDFRSFISAMDAVDQPKANKVLAYILNGKNLSQKLWDELESARPEYIAGLLDLVSKDPAFGAINVSYYNLVAESVGLPVLKKKRTANGY